MDHAPLLAAGRAPGAAGRILGRTAARSPGMFSRTPLRLKPGWISRVSGPLRAARCGKCVSIPFTVPAQQPGRDHHRPQRSSDAVKPEKAPNSCTHFKGCRGHLFGEDDKSVIYGTAIAILDFY